ncbi:MAG TPA: chromosome segregation protein SMC, partial [Acidimicrobiales bacterium]
MFLKSLSMKGFKSFADPTVLEFEPGITVVVGPNGSGKSNVVDAVTWVLGAQGPRSLRSAKMEDVIFAGTSSRPQLGRAEVSLTIDNSSGKLPVDLSEVTITRTLFRSGDSEYAINGAPCRLLDIQELLSDSGVGRQQHMIIGQGQLDTVLNARPEDRRAIIEEAAGVLKHRRRRERAERRLAATAENLERLGDLVREVRRQIRPLERQAAAARSHDAVASELLAVRRYLAGAEMAELTARRVAAAQNLTVCRDEERELHAALEQLDAEASSTTAELSSRREEDLANALGRVQGLVERARGQQGVLRERGRGVLAALDAAADVDVVSTLEAEAARLAGELQTADDEESAGGAPERAELAAALATLEAEDAALRERWADVLGGESDPEQAMARTQARRELITRAAVREQQDLDGLGERVASFEQRQAGAAVRADLLVRESEELDGATAALDATLAATTEELQEAARAAEAAQARADEATDARHRSEARAEALERALAELQGAGGRELLREVDGVVGSLVDLVEIDDGWDAAFEAAAGAGVAAVVVDGRRSAQAALATLRDRGVTGAVLAPRQNGLNGGAETTATTGLPPGTSAQSVRTHVRARQGGAVAESVLDTLVGRAVRVDGWEEAIDLSLARDDLVVVTPEGDRFAATGWRVRSGAGVVTKAAVEEARRRAEEAAAAAELAKAVLTEARIASSRARDARTAAERAADRHGAALEAKRAEVERAAEEQTRLAAELDDARTAVYEAQQRLAEVTAEESQLGRALPDLTEALHAWRALEERRAEVFGRRQELEVRVAGVAERRRVLSERHAEVERRLAGHAEERASAAARRERLEAEGTALRRLEELVEAEQQRLDEVFDALRHDYQDQVDAVRAGGEKLEQLRQDRHTTEQRLDAVRNRTRALDLEANEVDLRTESLTEHIHRDLNARPEELVGLPEPEAPADTTLQQHGDELERKLVALGPVNPLALEELSQLEERHKELEAQVDDVRGARRELHEVVRTLDHEIMTSFAAAAADVNEHFSALIAMLFPGGTGRLSLVEPDDLLNTGVEIEVRPAGRNIRRVSLLSGGERSMAALAFLFAVFRSRPSPFYMMDEVEAALDDVNLSRFLALVHEFRDEAQLLIVSHQKRTMETGDALYGVTMAPGGSSQVV